MTKVVVGLYDRFEDAQQAVRRLVDNGFSREDISLVANDQEGKMSRYLDENKGEETASSAAAGAGIGGVIGGLGGLLVGLGALAIPGIGPVLAAGPLISALAGAGIGAAAGGLLGALVELGIPEERAKMYTEGIRRGGTLVTVQTSDDTANEAVNILNQFNPVDINKRSREWTDQGFGETRRDRRETMDDRDRDRATFDVVEEELRVGKRQEETGGVRASTHITEHPVEEDVTLRREEINVDRRKVDKPITGEEADDLFKEQSFEVRAQSEEPVVEKRARIVEEVEIDKDVEERTETIRDTVRRQDIDIEGIGKDQFDEFDPMFRQHFQTNYSHTGDTYENFQPAYYYGYEMANRTEYRDRSWDDVRDELRRMWSQSYPQTDWRNHEEAIHHGWQSAHRM